ncbi:MFS transporter [Cobetia amphilecti]|uniref:MFS transporter n=1 Tax=Cobetia amphilecti TaxID=1055104 RepID=A0ABT6USF1_9GAMM|nr:MFS transporter [Cobetia amphilecti]MDI5885336.1 MFS transporter [Cobetia amphilecti]WOI25577.1 MFS transporter [Cobetia amphilecti]
MQLNWKAAITLAALILAINTGARQAMGFMLPPMASELTWGMGSLSFALAIQNLVFGLAAPIASKLSDRFGTLSVFLVGSLCYAVGMGVTALWPTPTVWMLGAGVLAGIGIGATTFPLVLAAVTRVVPIQHRGIGLGIASAGGSFGQLIYSVATPMLVLIDWKIAMLALGASCLLLIPMALSLLRRPPAGSEAPAEDIPSQGPLLQDRRFLALAGGFFVCGVHVAFIATHLPNFVVACGLPLNVAGNTLAIIGALNIAGTILFGAWGGRRHPPQLLMLIYLCRAALVMAMVVIPPSSMLLYAFGAIMGILWLSTVPLTSQAVALYFGQKRQAFVFGMVLAAHQVGAFLGAWGGGVVYQLTGSYDLLWISSGIFGLLAAIVHWPVRREPTRVIQPQLA